MSIICNFVFRGVTLAMSAAAGVSGVASSGASIESPPAHMSSHIDTSFLTEAEAIEHGKKNLKYFPTGTRVVRCRDDDGGRSCRSLLRCVVPRPHRCAVLCPFASRRRDRRSSGRLLTVLVELRPARRTRICLVTANAGVNT